MTQGNLAAILLLASIATAFQAETDTSSIFRDRFRKGRDTAERYVASSFNDTIDAREFNGSRANGAHAVIADIGDGVAVGQLDAHRSLDDERALWQKTARYNAYLEANRGRHDLDTGNAFERNDALLTPDRAIQRNAGLEHLHSETFEYDDSTRQQNKTATEFGASKERFRAARLDEDRKSRVLITPNAASGYDRFAQDAAVDEAAIDTRTRWNILQKERASGQAFDDRLRYHVDEADIAL